MIFLAVVAGLINALGLGMIWQSVTRPSRVLVHRVAPYVSDISPEAHRVAVGAVRITAFPIRLWWRSVEGRGESSRISRDLRALGSQEPPGEWSVRRFYWTLVGAIVGLACGGLIGWATESWTSLAGLSLLGGCAGFVMPGQILRRRVGRRQRDCEDEMAVGLDMLALSLSAGEEISRALERIGTRGSGPFSEFLRRVTHHTRLGVTLTEALDMAASETENPPLSRFVEHLVSTLEHGTPIADVLASHVAQSRERQKQLLLESAGKKEVTMLVPLVFLILPVTIAFAVFPGIIAIQTGF